MCAWNKEDELLLFEIIISSAADPQRCQVLYDMEGNESEKENI